MTYEVGERIGDYEVVGRIGAGGMGAVYKVRNLITDRVEAMKVLLPDLRDAADLAERFNREIKVHASLVHPNIASLHTAVRVENQLLMIMELIEGVSLADRLRQGPLQALEAVSITTQVLSALAYAHERSIIHRDIKPANIMVTSSRAVKLMDFGIATTSTKLQNRLTATGMALGSLHYMSPEQVRAEAPDARSDLYSLGVTLYEMITGECPIRGKSEYEIMAAHLAIMPPPPTDLNPFVPKPLSDIILKSMAKRPDDRYQSAVEFRTQLEWLTAGTSHAPAAAPTMEPLKTPVPGSGPASPTGAHQWSPGMLEAVVKELAAYIGPMAKIIVNRAAKQATSSRQLCETVAAEISVPADRAKFLSKRFD